VTTLKLYEIKLSQRIYKTS